MSRLMLMVVLRLASRIQYVKMHILNSKVKMNRDSMRLSRQYVLALEKHLRHGSTASLQSARGLGSQALAAGLQTLDLAKLHEQTLVTNLLPAYPPRKRAAIIKQAGIFFAVAMTPVEKTMQDADETKKFIETLSTRTVELAASNLELSNEITRRHAVEEALRKSEQHSAKLLEESDRLQGQLRRLSREMLSAQEEERKKISRELHDVIAQTLMGINLRLVTLQKEAAVTPRALDRNIKRTQRLVEHSVKIVHQFARELRPAVLDDLGLIPALHSYMKSFTERTGIRTSLTAFAGVEQLDTNRRTVLFRVAQEALTNVARHAHASRVDVTIQKLPHHVCMTIKNDGQTFSVERALQSNRGKHLGILGMRERVEMVGGRFSIESAAGKGTTILALIPGGKTGPHATKTSTDKIGWPKRKSL